MEGAQEQSLLFFKNFNQGRCDQVYEDQSRRKEVDFESLVCTQNIEYDLMAGRSGTVLEGIPVILSFSSTHHCFPTKCSVV